MFQLFQNVFGSSSDTKGNYPDSLVKMAVERALDGTDPRMRLLPGYAKKLRPSVIHAMDHVVHLVEELLAPVPATAAGYATSPALAMFFYSVTRMKDILEKDPAWRDFRQSNPADTGSAVALLVAAREEKHTFGYALVDDKPVSDVAQTIVTFHNPLLRDVCGEEADTRRLLRRRAYDYLLSLALAKISEKHSGRSDLAQRRAILRAKLALLQKHSSFAGNENETHVVLQGKLDTVEAELQQLGADDAVLEDNLALLAGVLAEAEKYLWLEKSTLHVDRQNILHDRPGSATTTVTLQDLCDQPGRRVSLLLLSLSADFT